MGSAHIINVNLARIMTHKVGRKKKLNEKRTRKTNRRVVGTGRIGTLTVTETEIVMKS